MQVCRRRSRARKGLFLALCLALSLPVLMASLAGCGPRRPVEREGGVLRVVLPRDLGELDPHRARLGTPLHSALFDTLLVLGADNLPRAGLVGSWQVSADGLAITLELRQGVFFHDGTPLTGSAVVKNIERVMSGGSERFPVRAMLGPLREARADGQQVTLAYDTPFPPIWAALADPRLGIIAPSTLQLLDEGEAEAGTAAVPAGSFCGSGPYRLSELQADVVELERYSSYAWPPKTVDNPGAAYPDRLQAVLVGDQDPAPPGQPDPRPAASIEPPPDIIWWPADYGGPAPAAPAGTGEDWLDHPFGGHRLIYLALDLRHLPLADPAARQAISLLVNREGLLATMGESLSVTASLVPSGLPGAVARIGAGGDPAAAAELLDRAGWTVAEDETRAKNGVRLEVRLATYEDNEAFDRLADAVCEALETAGVACRRVAPRRYFDPDLVEGAPNLWLLFYDWPDTDVLYYLFHSGEVGSANRSRYSNPDVDTLLSGARQDMDPERRAEMYRQAQLLITGDAAAIPLFESRGELRVSSRVAGFRPQAPGSLLLQDLYLRFR